MTFSLGTRLGPYDAVCRRHRSRQTEVQHFDLVVQRDLHVCRFEVAMDDALFVRGFEGLGHLPRDMKDVLNR